MINSERIKQLEVHTPVGLSGQLFKSSHFVFNYRAGAGEQEKVSITMPLRNESYTRGALFPIFEMNLPEGYIRHYVTERLRKVVPVDDMLFLALSAHNGIGRLSYKAEQVESPIKAPLLLDSLVNSGHSSELFAELVETYLLNTSVGISGVQPKVVIPETRGNLVLPSLIVKSGNGEYPNIAVNEFICMSIAKAAGLKTPEFWTTSDHQLFIMRRFDFSVAGTKLGMEDFSVLMAKPGDKKYQARYESLLRAANLYEIDMNAIYEQIALSLMLGNGDAHLKNFAILYEDIDGPLQLSPVYDVVCTKPYGDETTALSINGTRNYPSKTYLLKLGAQFGVRNPETILQSISAAIDSTLHEYSSLLADLGAEIIKDAIIQNRDRVLTLIQK
jgi:serine/threonine-protein kinase HipA